MGLKKLARASRPWCGRRLCRIGLAWLLSSTPLWGATPHHLVDNFTAPLPSSSAIECEADFEQPKVGLASARVQYGLDPRSRQATLELPESSRPLAGPGILKLWVKGDGSGNDLELVVRHAEPKLETDGRRVLTGHADLGLPRIKLDFEDWREVTLDVRSLPEKRVAWWQRLVIHGAPGDPAKLEGEIALDDLRLEPAANPPRGTYRIGLVGPAVRSFTGDISVFLDARNFSAAPAQVRARVTMTDRNENRVADRDFPVQLAAGESRELELDLAPEHLQVFLPPFRLAGDVLSTDLPEVAGKLEQMLVMGNSLFLFDDFADVFGRWFTAGYADPARPNERNWIVWTHGENQRACPFTQTSAGISRADVPADAAPNPGDAPALGRYALQLDYDGEARVYTGRDRYLPGNPYRLGLWVKGDGSGARLSVLILDYTNGADFWPGGWRRITNGELSLGALDFTDWRYVEVDLPGRGLGSNTPNGSTDQLDFPLEITAFHLRPATNAPTGTVLLGPIYVHSQQSLSEAIAVSVGYDDPEHRYEPSRGATVTVQNGSRTGPRKIRTTWTFLDRSNTPIANGQTDFDLASLASQTFRIDLAKPAAETAPRPGPLRLQVVAHDTADASGSTTRQVILSKPDSRALVADFESDRGYLGVKSRTIENAPPAGEPAAQTSTEQHHGGERALPLAWDRDQFPYRFVSIDPPLPGAPVELTLWVHGDGSGALFYPLLGDRRGINHGATMWNLFLPRTTGAALQNAVRVDWTGWRELTFRLPVVPASWDEALPLLGFVPNYPLGLHLVVEAAGAQGDAGRIFVDDISVLTHLPPAERVQMAFDRDGESNLVPPGSAESVTLANTGLTGARKVRLAGGVYDWRGDRLAGIDADVELKPGERRRVPLAGELPVGAFALRATLHEGEQQLAAVEEDLLVTDPVPVLGTNWVENVRDEWKLRGPIRDRFTYVDEDWDWVEHFPGDLQLDTIRDRAGQVTRHGADPYVLIGFSSYWAGGVGLEQMLAGGFVRRQRDVGHAVDIFLIPQRLDDWENYVRELMRGAGRAVGGWVMWDNPDSPGPMGVPPETFAQWLALADRWRREYCPQTPLLIGGMSRNTAVPYLQELARHGGLEHLTGANIRLDVGRLSPEDAQVADYVREVQTTLDSAGETNKTILLTDLDWAVEKEEAGLDAFDQAAYLVRAALLLNRLGIQPALAIRNGDDARLGLGLAYRREVAVPPLKEQPVAYQLKPGWWGIVRARQWFDRLKCAGEIEVQDVIPGRTRCLLYQRTDAGPVAIIWRNNDAGWISFAPAGVDVERAEDLLASAVPAREGWYSVGKLPVLFELKNSAEPIELALARLRVRDGDESTWPQRVLAAFSPATGQRYGYAFEGNTERFRLPAPQDADLVLRKRFHLGDRGQEAEVYVNGQLAGRWNLLRSEVALSSGEREAIFLVDRKLLAGKEQADVELRYAATASTVSWCVLEYRGGEFPLSAVGALHADQNVAQPRFARNTIGLPLKIGTTSFANGVGVFAQSLLEYPLNGQFRQFRALVGVDGITEGRGSVVFELFADGKKRWSSGVMSGLDQPREVEVDLQGVDRLRLVVTDAGDGNKYDVADWCEPVLRR